jgi:tetratricopeptide (TPR) repeat protein
MSIRRSARMLLWAGASAGAFLIALMPTATEALETSAQSKPRYRNLEESFHSEIRPASTGQQLSKNLERKADAQASYLQGMLLEDEGDFENALDAYAKSLQLDPGGNPELSVRIAHEYAKRGDVATGIDLLKDLAKVRPNEPLAFLNLAYFYLRQLKKPDLAAKYAEQAVQIDPKNVAAYQTLFEVYMALKRKKEAEGVLSKAQKLDVKDATFWLNLTDLSVRLYAAENGNFPQTKVGLVTQLLKKATSLATDDGNILSKIGDGYVSVDQVSSAIPFYLRTLELNNNNAEVRYKLAQSFLKTGQRDQAIRTLEDMLKANPLKSEIYEFLARLYEESGNKDRALANYEQAVLLTPNQPENYLRAAELEMQLKQADRAIKTLEEARRRFPLPQITYGLAIALSNAKRFAEALPIFEAALQEARSTQNEVIDAGFYFNYGASAEQCGLLDKSAELLKKSIELDPSKAAQAYNYLGFMWIDRNQNLEEAGEMIKKALEIEPDNGAYLDSLGWYYFKKGEFGKALTELLHSAERINPPDPVVYEHIGDTYRSLGNGSQALIYWQKSLNLDPNNQAIADKIDQSKAKVALNPKPPPVSPKSVASPKGAASPPPEAALTPAQ